MVEAMNGWTRDRVALIGIWKIKQESQTDTKYVIGNDNIFGSMIFQLIEFLSCFTTIMLT